MLRGSRGQAERQWGQFTSSTQVFIKLLRSSLLELFHLQVLETHSKQFKHKGNLLVRITGEGTGREGVREGTQELTDLAGLKAIRTPSLPMSFLRSSLPGCVLQRLLPRGGRMVTHGPVLVSSQLAIPA